MANGLRRSAFDQSSYDFWTGKYGIVNVKDFGAVGDGVHDDTAAIQSAVDAGGHIFVPIGQYKLTAEITINKPIHIEGSANLNGSGSRFNLTANAVGFNITAGTIVIEHVEFVGSANASYTTQEAILINANNVLLNDIFFTGCYNNLHITGSAFFCQFENLLFYDAVNYHMLGDGTTSSGYAFQMSNCQVTTPAGSSLVDVFRFTNFGSVELVNVMMSPINGSGFSVAFDQPAPLAGVQQIVGCQLEAGKSGGLNLIGTAANPVKYVLVSDTYIAGGQSATSPHTGAITIDYAQDCSISGGYITGEVAACVINNSLSNFTFSSNQFQIANVCFASPNSTTSLVNGLYISSPTYTGGYPFIYLNSLPTANVNNLDIRGGIIGTSSAPVTLTGTPTTTKVDIIGFNKGTLTAPAIPTSAAELTNPFLVPCMVIVTGGTVTEIAVNGTNTGLTSGNVVIQSGGTITLTYTAAPTWVWTGI